MASQQNPRYHYGRADNTEKIKLNYQDDENPILFTPEDYTGNKFFGNLNKLVFLQSNLFIEQKEKYINQHMFELKAEREMKALPECFDHCLTNVEDGLNAQEKQCIKSCYFKSLGVRDDTAMYFQQLHAINFKKKAMDSMV